MQVMHVFSSSGPFPAIMSGHHAIVGNAGEKYLLALRYFASGSYFFRISREEERNYCSMDTKIMGLLRWMDYCHFGNNLNNLRSLSKNQIDHA
ncbi:hypothetical protein [Enterobacter hormaechei]|uniref:hypothetical protein n=1 Tax=Enterobacter hormaechei TaxID=158836 RepID=UPI00138EF903|nr:hypothetical protein [Enterobacter hormaechei]MBO2808809.1 hypothetical protein [Enterobacter hormaechei]